MIDQDLSEELHSLAATLDEPFDVAALHRRISMQSRRRAVVKAGFAGVGVAAVVGGLVVVRDERSGPVDSGLAAASSVSSSPLAAPTASPDCSVVLAGLRAANLTPDTVAPKDIPTDKSASAGDAPAIDFKGIVTILTIDGSRLTFRVDEPKVAPPTAGAGTVDAATVWADGSTPLDPPPTLQVGEQLGLATTMAGDGVDHVVFIDVSASANVDEQPAPDTKIVGPGLTLPSGPTAKSKGTITGVDATSITVTLDGTSAQATTVVVDFTATTFYAGDTKCTPGSLTVGTAVGVAYHFDDAGTVIGDAVMLMP